MRRKALTRFLMPPFLEVGTRNVRMILAPHVNFYLTDNGGILQNRKTGGWWELNRLGAIALHLMLNGESVEFVGRRISVNFQLSESIVVVGVLALLRDLQFKQLAYYGTGVR
ncbi:hypothetical protein ATY76_22410 [Rhizobium sp. R339]|nr:hypothetical protein ATY76_22410 [Rhizobium sp. R339]